LLIVLYTQVAITLNINNLMMFMYFSYQIGIYFVDESGWKNQHQPGIEESQVRMNLQ
jgi:hypothetical protein